MRNLELDRNGRRVGTVDEETARKETWWHLSTLMATSSCYLMFALMVVSAYEIPVLRFAAIAPLLLYDIIKAFVCIVLLTKKLGINRKELLKDII